MGLGPSSASGLLLDLILARSALGRVLATGTAGGAAAGVPGSAGNLAMLGPRPEILEFTVSPRLMLRSGGPASTVLRGLPPPSPLVLSISVSVGELSGTPGNVLSGAMATREERFPGGTAGGISNPGIAESAIRRMSDRAPAARSGSGEG